jgi:hypothetical protein
MNLRSFSAMLLVSALPFLALAESAGFALDKGDFVSAEKILKNGETIVSVKLSKSGKAKFRKLNQASGDKMIHADVGGVESDFKLREPIKGDSLEMGPYSAAAVGP